MRILGPATVILCLLLPGPGGALAAAEPERMLVACAPGFPGTTAQAQATMDGFASAIAHAAGWPAGSLGAVYHEALQAGVERLARKDAVLALVTLPFFLQEGPGLGLKPRLLVEQETGVDEIWSLVAKKGMVAAPGALDGWELTGGIGYSPAFVRGPALGEWGTLPPSVRITFAPAALGALRRAASGEKVAVLLDASGTKALPGLPFAADLEIVARSKAYPGSLLCALDERLPARDADRLMKALLKMHESPSGAQALQGVRIRRFTALDPKPIEAARQAFARASAIASGSAPGAAR